MPHNKGFVLASRPNGAPTPGNFRLIKNETPELADGQVLIRHLFLRSTPTCAGG